MTKDRGLSALAVAVDRGFKQRVLIEQNKAGSGLSQAAFGSVFTSTQRKAQQRRAGLGNAQQGKATRQRHSVSGAVESF